jgi:hypothetical protein
LVDGIDAFNPDSTDRDSRLRLPIPSTDTDFRRVTESRKAVLGGDSYF